MINKNFFLICLTASIALFISGLVYGFLSGHQSTSPSKKSVDLSGGQYIRLVFVGSSTCSYSNNDVTISLIKNIKADLKNLSTNHDFEFISTGISYDVSSKVALKYLEKTGTYDELLVGNGPFNLGNIQYTSGMSPTPLILLFAENYETDLLGMNMSNFKSSQDHIKTLSGQFEIQEFHDFFFKLLQKIKFLNTLKWACNIALLIPTFYRVLVFGLTLQSIDLIDSRVLTSFAYK